MLFMGTSAHVEVFAPETTPRMHPANHMTRVAGGVVSLTEEGGGQHAAQAIGVP